MVWPTFSPNLEVLFNDGRARITEAESKVYEMWKLVGKGFKPWEIDPDYDEGEHMIKPEDKADLLKLDEFEFNARANARRKQDALNALQAAKAKK